MAYNIENMTKLRDFIATLEPENFDHNVWQTRAYYNHEDISNVTPLVVEDTNVCGTAACIAGWGAIVGELINFTVDERYYIIPKAASNFDYMDDVGKWLGISNEDEREAIFIPWDARHKVAGDLLDKERENLYIATECLNTTPEDAAAFLTKVIEEGSIDVSWWSDIKKDRIPQWKKENWDD